MPRVIGRWQDSPREGGESQIPTHIFVSIIIEVVLNGDAVKLLIGVRRPSVGEDAELVIEPVDIHQLAFDVAILLPGRDFRAESRRAPVPAHRPVGLMPEWTAAELIGPADKLTLDVRHETKHVAEVQRHVQLVIGVKPAGRKRSRRIRDWVIWHVSEQIRIVDHDVGMDRGVVHTRVSVIREMVVEKGIAQAIIVDTWQPLRVGVPVLQVRLGPEVRELVVLLPDQVGQSLLVHPSVEELLVVFLDEIAVGGICDFKLKP